MLCMSELRLLDCMTGNAGLAADGCCIRRQRVAWQADRAKLTRASHSYTGGSMCAADGKIRGRQRGLDIGVGRRRSRLGARLRAGLLRPYLHMSEKPQACRRGRGQ